MVQEDHSEKYVPMIEEVTIDNFKGIKHCEIKDIGKVNLLIGKNSCGKSSILEAIYYSGKEFIESSLPNCIRRRTNRSQFSARELWHGYAMGSNVNVRLTFSKQDFTEMNVQYSADENRVLVYLGSGGLKSGGGVDLLCRYGVSDFTLVTGRSNITIASQHTDEIRRYFSESVFIDPTIKTDVRRIEGKYLTMIKLSERDSSDLAKRTSEIYDTKPSWEFLPHPDFAPDTPSRFAILEGDRRLFFDDFGDGLHYGLAVIAAAKTRNDTGLFVEEIESHQHSGAQSKLIKHLVDIARENGLQIFLSTHSKDVWESLNRGVYAEDAEKEKDEFRCFLINRNNETGDTTAENTNDVQKITRALE